MLYPYRVLKQNLNLKTLEKTYVHTLREAYMACIPEPNSSCRLLFNGLEQKLDFSHFVFVNISELMQCFRKRVFAVASYLYLKYIRFKLDSTFEIILF